MDEVSRDAGVIFIAVGKFYVERAKEAALSVRNSNPWLPITLFTDQNAASDIFSEVIRFEKGHYRSKIDYLDESPYERTLYLDTDVRVIADLRSMFVLLDRFELAVSHAHRRNDDLTREIWRERIPDAFPQANGGVILYRRTAAVIDALQEWRKAFHEAGFRKDQVTLREILWTRDLKVYFLPPEYNIRYRKYLYTMSKREAEPKILHMKRFHRAKCVPFWRKAEQSG
jgi:hypothetical protein